MIRFQFPIIRLRWKESIFAYIGRLLLCIPHISALYNSKLKPTYSASKAKIQKQFSAYEKIGIRTTIPKVALTEIELYEILDAYEAITLNKVVSKQLSGAIYSSSLNGPISVKKIVDESELNLEARQKKIFTHAFSISYLWNSLHQDEFDIGIMLDYQVVQMVGSMFGADPSKIKGFVTSGGTESLMCAIRTYRSVGMETKGHGPGEGVIIAPDTVHAAVMKATDAYLLKVVLIETDPNGCVDMKVLRHMAKIHSGELVAIIGSAPSYNTGCVDPIETMARIAKKYDVGFHVDCCLGGFVINFLPEFNTKYLGMDGVTSLSVDTHKNGQAPKGSSVLIMKDDLIFHSVYAVPHWTGGVYGSLKDAGSQSCTPGLTAFLSMLMIGTDQFTQIATQIQSKTRELSEVIKSMDDFILLNKTYINIVAFKINSTKPYAENLIYSLALEMSKRNVVLNTMRNNTVRFCVTDRFVSDPDGVDKFKNVLSEAWNLVKTSGEKSKSSSTAGMYGSLECASCPSKSEDVQSFAENLFFGEKGASDSVKQHFLALANPFTK